MTEKGTNVGENLSYSHSTPQARRTTAGDMGMPPSPSGSGVTCAPRRSKVEIIAITFLALALCALVAELAFFWMNGNIDRAFSNAAYQQEVHDNVAYFSEHRGEKSAHDNGVEKGLWFSWGLIVQAFDEGVEEDSELMSLANSELPYVPDYIKCMWMRNSLPSN